jgi:hypothetical protein
MADRSNAVTGPAPPSSALSGIGAALLWMLVATPKRLLGRADRRCRDCRPRTTRLTVACCCEGRYGLAGAS